MKNTDYKRIAKLVTEYIDRSLKTSIIREAAAAADQEDPYSDLGDTFKDLFGTDVKGLKLEPVHKTRGHSVDIPEQYGILRKESGALRVINHTILRNTIFSNYFRGYAPQSGDNPGSISPMPFLIWGAPGIGKSQGVKAAAVAAAKKIGKDKGYANFKILTNETMEEVTDFDNTFYFLEWAKLSNENLKNKISIGAPVNIQTQADKTVRGFNYDSRIPGKNLFIFFDVRVAGIQESDILGMPVRVDRQVQVKDPNTKENVVLDVPHIDLKKLPFLDMCCNMKDLHAFIMWDEINQGSQNIQAALYQVILERQVGDATLAPGVAHFAAANSQTVWGGGSLKPALAARFGQAYLYVSPSDWLEQFDAQLVPAMKTFIRTNPQISMYMTSSSWEKTERGMQARGAETPSDAESYIQESHAKWPNPRSLLQLNESLKSLISTGRSEGWSTQELVDQMVAAAHDLVGEVWAEGFKDYVVTSSNVKWEALVNNPKVTARAARDSKLRNHLQSVLLDKVRTALTLKSQVSEKPAYRKIIIEIMKVMANTVQDGTLEVDIIQTALAGAREARKEALISNNVAEAVADKQAKDELGGMLKDGKLEADKISPELGSAIERITSVLLQGVAGRTPGGIGKSSLVTQQLHTTPSTTTTPKTPTPTTSTPDNTQDGDIKAEKFSKFNRLTEEIMSNIKVEDEQPEEPVIDEQTALKKQRDGCISIAQNACSKFSLTNDRVNLNTVFEAVMRDTILDPKQKEALTARIKTAPDSINAILMLKAYGSGKFLLAI